MNDNEFNEGFVGFWDAEGSFLIKKSNNNIKFSFSICLNHDDKEVLNFILNRLKCGTINKSGDTSVSFNISKIDDLLNILIPLFENFPLNGVKYLDYLVFKEGILKKLDCSISNDEKLELITNLKNTMNTKRESFAMPSDHSIRITPYLLLGLIEGEGSFFISRKSRSIGVCFSLALTYAQLPLMTAIKNFFDNYQIEDNFLKLSKDYLGIISKRSTISVGKP